MLRMGSVDGRDQEINIVCLWNDNRPCWLHLEADNLSPTWTVGHFSIQRVKYSAALATWVCCDMTC